MTACSFISGESGTAFSCLPSPPSPTKGAPDGGTMVNSSAQGEQLPTTPVMKQLAADWRFGDDDYVEMWVFEEKQKKEEEEGRSEL